MVAEVIDLKLSQEHLSGKAYCFHCKHFWTAVVPVGTFRELECPECGLMKGVLMAGVIPEVAWECGCGCYLMVVSGISKNILCFQCGKTQKGFED